MPRIGIGVAAALLIMIGIVGIAWARPPEEKLSGVFSQGDVVITQGQVTGKVLVINGNAVIDGRVSEWVAIIKGHLIVGPTGSIPGSVYVLDGDEKVEPGAFFAPVYHVVLSPGSQLVKVLFWFSCVAGAVGIFLSIFIGWLLLKWFRCVVVCRLERHIPFFRERFSWLFAISGLAISGFLLAVFVNLAADTLFYHETDFIDQVVIWLVRYFASPELDRIMLGFTFLGSVYAYVFFGLIIFTVLWKRRRRHEGLSLGICLAGAALLNFLLKHLFERARPEMFQIIKESGYSFPSGHAMLSVCFYGMLAYIIVRSIPEIGRRIAILALTGTLVAAIGISRIYLGVHYPSDVLAGYIAGGTWLIFCITLLWWWEAKQD